MKSLKKIRSDVGAYDWVNMIKTIESKHSIDITDFKDSFNHFTKWLKFTGEAPPNYPSCPNNELYVYEDGTKIELTREEYDSRYKVIHEQYQRYEKWTKENPRPPYSQFYSWYAEKYLEEIKEHIPFSLNIQDDGNNPDWINELLKIMRDEFEELKEMEIVTFVMVY